MEYADFDLGDLPSWDARFPYGRAGQVWGTSFADQLIAMLDAKRCWR